MSANITPMTWWAYVQKVTHGDSQTNIARAVGLTNSSVSRWKESSPDPKNAAALARHYGRPVLETFVAAGYLTPAEARMQVVHQDLSHLTDEELLDELTNRFIESRKDGGHGGSSTPITPAGDAPADPAPQRRRTDKQKTREYLNRSHPQPTLPDTDSAKEA